VLQRVFAAGIKDDELHVQELLQMDVEAGFGPASFFHDFTTGKDFEFEVDQLPEKIAGGEREIIQIHLDNF